MNWLLTWLKGGFPYDFLDPLEPIHAAWWHIFGVPMRFTLDTLSTYFDANPITRAVGPLGLSIILLTILIKTIVFPLFHAQISISRKTQMEQKKIAPELAALRKKFRKDPQKLQTEMMKLYREHNINPLAGALGCIPAMVQAPILIALYWVIFGFSTPVPHHFLWVHNLTQPHEFILAGLAGGLTWVQSKMLTPPPTPGQQVDQAQQMQQQMLLFMPVMIAFFAWNFQAGLALYWVVSTVYQIGQQFLITGWGSLPIARARELFRVRIG
jgi:YidC/Oxa1 family membrane protein insertase